jgi:hypothetical protein
MPQDQERRDGVNLSESSEESSTPPEEVPRQAAPHTAETLADWERNIQEIQAEVDRDRANFNAMRQEWERRHPDQVATASQPVRPQSEPTSQGVYGFPPPPAQWTNDSNTSASQHLGARPRQEASRTADQSAFRRPGWPTRANLSQSYLDDSGDFFSAEETNAVRFAPGTHSHERQGRTTPRAVQPPVVPVGAGVSRTTPVYRAPHLRTFDADGGRRGSAIPELSRGPPLKLGDPRVGEPDIIWTDPTAIPRDGVSRMLSETNFLTGIISDPGQDEETLQLARQALERRTNPRVHEIVMSSADPITEPEDDADEVIAAPAAFGRIDTIDLRVRKLYQSLVRGVLATPRQANADELCREIFTHAHQLILAEHLSERGALELVRPHFSGELRDLYRVYKDQGDYVNFAKVVQLACQKTESTASLHLQIQKLITTRPAANSIGAVATSLLSLTKRLTRGRNAKERELYLKLTFLLHARSLLALWYSNSSSEVEALFAAKEAKHLTNMAKLKQMGLHEEAQREERSYSAVAVFIEAMSTALKNVSPSPAINPILAPELAQAAVATLEAPHASDASDVGEDAASLHRRDANIRRIQESNSFTPGEVRYPVQMAHQAVEDQQFGPIQYGVPPVSPFPVEVMAIQPQQMMWAQSPQGFIPMNRRQQGGWNQPMYQPMYQPQNQQRFYQGQGPSNRRQSTPQQDTGSGQPRQGQQERGSARSQEPRQRRELQFIPGNPPCRMCGFHYTYAHNGQENVCFRYGHLSDHEISQYCRKCGLSHPTEHCQQDARPQRPSTYEHVQTPRPDRINPAPGGNGAFAGNYQPQQAGNAQQGAAQ